MTIKRNTLIAASGLLALTLTVSCGKGDPKSSAAAQQQQKPQPFQYITVEEGPATIYKEFPARLQGKQNIEIRPKIDGFIEDIYIDEGAYVKQGQPLFRIRNPQYEQQVRVAEAAIKSAQADVATAQMQVTKTKPLVDKDIISKYELQAAQLALQAKQANLAQAQANLTNAQVNQGYTMLTSPVTGYVGTLPYRQGSYVNSSTQQPLTTVSNIGSIYAYFSANEKDVLEFLKHSTGATVTEKLKNAPNVNLVLSDGSEYSEKGRIESMSGQVDPQTGSFMMRATFPNDNGLIRSGYSATLKLPTYLEKVIIIPQKATYEMQGKVFVYIVGKDNKVKSAEVKVLRLPDGVSYGVESGLKGGDKVVVEGVGILKDGTEIVPKQTNLTAVISKA
ncbi:efflux transporter periplasmic adaptor subunit [Elizabethkingia meningoseptica]|uniref:efflux RND transporter periplasmic adaptor subunit n=1 Tax=Elizabethkingia meningoseptica TaxID=238 RepID=UPI000332C5A2|nr:efflux RND transporter periplasmic adaptor subunit [Elizabethkingia meningoseptica]AQX06003.1 efflux transporter periplasmic adaptor subunit [Elizabethkingia meningoseptica]AQX48049.1 efflux transporter periplasmic adaptor subunit [Elizabethkingia meningoseptica]EOR30975.1 RND family efflux transporter MFP subunit [Elizabethkingia meningoseptica ATCC 13253 = NBRC 12535]KUY23237.1 hemolysin D [Elizabethkingia meningoseptica]MDE5487537.1 efflux RND transporter periplasmic adaptor subunit [Eli